MTFLRGFANPVLYVLLMARFAYGIDSELRRDFDAHYSRTAVGDHLRLKWELPATQEAAMAVKVPKTVVRWERFDALGPVLQCPPPLWHIIGHSITSGETKVVCANVSAKHPCTVISVGSHNRWDFEEVVASTFPHCSIHTFDCFVTKPVMPPAVARVTTFHQVCLGAASVSYGKRQFMTYGSAMTMLGLRAPPQILKMDVEGSEWQILEALVAQNSTQEGTSGHLLPDSISVELHLEPTNNPHLGWKRHSRSVTDIAGWMDHLFTRGGYVLADRRDNPKCQHCSELVLARLIHPQPGF